MRAPFGVDYDAPYPAGRGERWLPANPAGRMWIRSDGRSDRGAARPRAGPMRTRRGAERVGRGTRVRQRAARGVAQLLRGLEVDVGRVALAAPFGHEAT